MAAEMSVRIVRELENEHVRARKERARVVCVCVFWMVGTCFMWVKAVVPKVRVAQRKRGGEFRGWNSYKGGEFVTSHPGPKWKVGKFLLEGVRTGVKLMLSFWEKSKGWKLRGADDIFPLSIKRGSMVEGNHTRSFPFLFFFPLFTLKFKWAIRAL